MSCKHETLFTVVFERQEFFPNLTDDGESACPLPVQPHVLGVGLGEADVVAVVQELPDGEGIAVDVAWDEIGLHVCQER